MCNDQRLWPWLLTHFLVQSIWTTAWIITMPEIYINISIPLEHWINMDMQDIRCTFIWTVCQMKNSMTTSHDHSYVAWNRNYRETVQLKVFFIWTSSSIIQGEWPNKSFSLFWTQIHVLLVNFQWLAWKWLKKHHMIPNMNCWGREREGDIFKDCLQAKNKSHRLTTLVWLQEQTPIQPNNEHIST